MRGCSDLLDVVVQSEKAADLVHEQCPGVSIVVLDGLRDRYEGATQGPQVGTTTLIRTTPPLLSMATRRSLADLSASALASQKYHAFANREIPAEAE